MSLSLHPLLKQSRRADITFYRNGRIDVGTRIVRQLALYAGDTLGMAFDDDNNVLIYRHLSAHECHFARHEATLFNQHVGQCSLRCNSINMARYVFQRYHANHHVRCSMGEIVEDKTFGRCVNLVVII